MTIHSEFDLLLGQAKAANLPVQFSNPDVTIVDRPMGSGKTTDIVKSLRPGRKYLVVLPMMSEVRRIIRDASVVLYQPLSDGSDLAERETGNPYTCVFQTKRDALRALLQDGYNVACSHKLFSEIGSLAGEGLLLEYDVIIDEVLAVAEVATSITQVKKTVAGSGGDTGWRDLYLADGYAEVDPDTGQISPTEKWRGQEKVLAGNLSLRMFEAAMAGRLYTDQAGLSRDIIMSELPTALLRRSRSLRVYTYLFEGSFMAALLRKHAIRYKHERDAEEDAAFREKARKLITVLRVPRLETEKFSYTAQTKSARARKPNKAVSNALYRMQRTPGELKGVDKDDIMLTSAKACWYADDAGTKPGVYARGSRMFDGTHWLPNTTRGTNDYAHCSHLIYLWDQNANPNVSSFLGVDDKERQDRHAVSELLQWVYRSRVRRGEPITLFLPSDRMRSLWARWLEGSL